MSTDPAALSVRGAVKTFGRLRALDGVDLTVPPGALLAVLGPSGCGKTTLLRCIAGFERLDAGEISLLGRTVAGPGIHLPPNRRRAAIVPQEGALFPHLTVAQNVGYGLDRAARRSGRVAEVLAMVGLDGYQDRMPHQLSGGQQQRVAIARALAPRPPLVLLDEPFTALDAGLRAQLRRDVRAALRADGASAVLVTHDQDEALSMADLVAVLRRGRIVQVDTPARVYSEPADSWVAGFVGEAVLLPGRLAGATVWTAPGPAEIASSGSASRSAPESSRSSGSAGSAAESSASGAASTFEPAVEAAVTGSAATSASGMEGASSGEPSVTVLVRPEQIELLPAGAPAAAGMAVARVIGRDYHGHEAMVTLALVAAGWSQNGSGRRGGGGSADGGSGNRAARDDGPRVRARVAGDVPVGPGDLMAVRVRGPVRVWPGHERGDPGRDSPGHGRVRGDRDRDGDRDDAVAGGAAPGDTAVGDTAAGDTAAGDAVVAASRIDRR